MILRGLLGCVNLPRISADVGDNGDSASSLALASSSSSLTSLTSLSFIFTVGSLGEGVSSPPSVRGLEVWSFPFTCCCPC